MDPSVFRALSGDGAAGPCHAHLRDIALLADLAEEDLQTIAGRLPISVRRVPAGRPLFCAGDPFDAVYEVWTGFFKTVQGSALGVEQVVGFQMTGELIGLDGICEDRHSVDAIALEDSQVWLIPYQELVYLAAALPQLQQRLHRLMARELTRAVQTKLQLGSMSAEERLAAFLLDLTRRLAERRLSPKRVHLRMMRWEIASFLGLALETVSRTLSRFQAVGLISVRLREISVIDPDGLRRIVG